ncbi:MAG TPA: hypothetical protein VFB28_12590 [Terriglobales bacterium]|nr:hypothetical protein [Terriglobales bacterium]
MMIGAETEVVQHLDPIFSALAPGRGDIARIRAAKSSMAPRSKAICIAGQTAADMTSVHSDAFVFFGATGYLVQEDFPLAAGDGEVRTSQRSDSRGRESWMEPRSAMRSRVTPPGGWSNPGEKKAFLVASEAA